MIEEAGKARRDVSLPNEQLFPNGFSFEPEGKPINKEQMTHGIA